MKLFRILIIAGLAVTGSALQPAHAQNSELQIVHGVNGLDVAELESYQVDIAIDGSCDVADAVFDDVTAVASKPAGIYSIEVFADNVTDCTGNLIVEGEISLTNGGSAVAIFHLDEAGTQTISQANLPQDFQAGKMHIAGFHGARAAPVTFSAIFVKNTKRKLVYKNLANGEVSFSGEVKVGTNGAPTVGNWKLKVSQSGSSIATTVALFENTSYLFVLVGDLDNDTFDTIVVFDQ